MSDIEPTCGQPDYSARMRQHAKTLHGAGVAILGAITLACTAQSGEVYKSVDANGTVVYSDHIDPSLSGTTTVQLDDSRPPPHELHFCWTNCFTLILDKGVYRRADGTDETWTVETFSDRAVVLHRHDAPDGNGHGRDVVYAGQVANDRLINVSVNGRPTSGVDASWGEALNTLPGSNAERDAPTNAGPNPSASSVIKTDAAPPPLPDEDQPVLVEDGDLWTPGYWYWRDLRYVWIPGAWARPPQAGFLWTPAYWGRAGSVYVFHPGRWGATVGYYGGIDYGFGYAGSGYGGGHWVGGSFAYNTAVNHVAANVAHHTYSESVPNPGLHGGPSYAGTPHASGTPMGLPHQVTPPIPAKPVTTVATPRAREAAPVPVAVNNTVSAAKPSPPSTPPPSTPPKVNRVTTPHTAPIKQ